MIQKPKNINYKYHPIILTDGQKRNNRKTRKIESIQYNINRMERGKEAYNRNKIRRTRKYESTKHPIKINKTAQSIAIEVAIQKRFKNYFIEREFKKMNK